MSDKKLLGKYGLFGLLGILLALLFSSAGLISKETAWYQILCFGPSAIIIPLCLWKKDYKSAVSNLLWISIGWIELSVRIF